MKKTTFVVQKYNWRNLLETNFVDYNVCYSTLDMLKDKSMLGISIQIVKKLFYLLTYFFIPANPGGIAGNQIFIILGLLRRIL